MVRTTSTCWKRQQPSVSESISTVESTVPSVISRAFQRTSDPRLGPAENRVWRALLGFGDGFVEIENVKAVGGIAVGVASNEKDRQGIDPGSATG